MRLKTVILLTFLTTIQLDSNAQDQIDNSVIGVFSQQMFYRFTIVEFKKDMTFDYHVMSERAHRQTSGNYMISGDTIVLNSYSKDSDFDFHNKKWIRPSRKKIVMSDNRKERKESWTILERDKQLDSIPKQRSDFAIKIDSIKINELSWTKDTTNYDSELKLIIREPLPPKEPLIVINGVPVKYNFLLNYYKLVDIDNLVYMTRDELLKSILHGGRAEYGYIIVTTKTRKPKR